MNSWQNICKICLTQMSTNTKTHLELPKQIKMCLCCKGGSFDLKCLQSISYIDVISQYVAASNVETYTTKMSVKQLKNLEIIFEL